MVWQNGKFGNGFFTIYLLTVNYRAAAVCFFVEYKSGQSSALG